MKASPCLYAEVDAWLCGKRYRYAIVAGVSDRAGVEMAMPSSPDIESYAFGMGTGEYIFVYPCRVQV